MQLVLLSGGSGKRLWPLSNETRSKQFLQILEDEHGEKQSMVQRVWKQLNEENLSNNTIIATSENQKEMLQRQIHEDIPVITEPERRDTFAAIALAISYLYSVKQFNKEEVITILPVDPYVDSTFFSKIKELENVVLDENCDLALIGVSPTYPSEKYGYIIPKESDNNSNDHYLVEKFTEKPNEEEAKKLIAKNALWNCGVFAFKIEYMLNILKEENLPYEYNLLKKQYKKIPEISFDYKVVENATNIKGIRFDGNWKDLGTWNTLTEEMHKNQIGKGIISEESVNTHLINELDIPITVIGAKNLIVAASPEGVIVSDKKDSAKIKDITKNYNHSQRYEERYWGWSRILDYAKYNDEEEMVTKRIMIEKGKNSTYHYHRSREEVWTIVRGQGELVIDKKIYKVKSGDVIQLPVGTKHGIFAVSDLEIVEVQTGREISNKDFVRLFYSWTEVLESLENVKPKLFNQ